MVILRASRDKHGVAGCKLLDETKHENLNYALVVTFSVPQAHAVTFLVFQVPLQMSVHQE